MRRFVFTMMFALGIMSTPAQIANVYKVKVDTLTISKVDSILNNMKEKAKKDNTEIVIETKKHGTFKVFCEGAYRRAHFSRGFRKKLLR